MALTVSPSSPTRNEESLPVRIAIVGTGDVAMSHAATLVAGPVEARIVAAADTNRARLDAFLAAHHVPDGYDDLGKLLAESHPDLVYLCTAG